MTRRLRSTAARRVSKTSLIGESAAGVLLPGFVGTHLPASLADRLREGLGGVALFGANIRDPRQVRSLTAAIRAARPDAVIAIDEEGGDVTRLHLPDGSPEPGNGLLGRLDDEALTAASARAIGLELAAAGCTLDLAPTADVNTNADNPVIGARSFGLDAALVARHTAAWVRGLQATGVAACAKHFPGHGDTAVDSHLGLPVVDHELDALRRRELLPFAAAIDAGVAAVMTSHIVLPRLDPGTPATLSRRILTGLLREEMGFTGVIVTDALDMAGASGRIGIPAAAVQALTAGADLLCLGRDSERHLDAVQDAILQAVAQGDLAPERLHEAAARVRRLAPPVADAGGEGGAGGARGAGDTGSAGRAGRAGPAGHPGRAADTGSAGRVEDTGSAGRVEDAGRAGRAEDTGVPRRAADVGSAEDTRIAGPHPAEARLAGGFDLQAAAAAALADGADWTVVKLEAEPNIAVGPGGWGPFAAAARTPDSVAARRFTAWPRIDVDADRPAPVPRIDGRALVIGRDIHRHPHARAVVDGLRAGGGTVVAVDMGWPSADRRYADVATFGSSRAVGAALLGLLAGAERD